MLNLIAERGASADNSQEALYFGTGITDSDDNASWTIKCSDRAGAGAAWGRWVVLGY